MKDPIKIIHKFKNNNRRIQHKVYIFIGSLVPKNIIEILEKIQDKDFYQTMNTITKGDYSLIESYYGDYWYEFFFTNLHINSQIKEISSGPKRKNLESKFGKEWYSTHIMNLHGKNVSYSFASSYYNYLLYKNKIKTIKKVEMDFRTFNIEKQDGGAKESTQEDSDDDEIDEPVKIEETSDEEDTQVINEDVLEEQVEEDMNVDDFTKMYTNLDVETNKNIKETSTMIKDAINDKKWMSLIDKKKEYDDSDDTTTYDNKIEDVYKKHYVREQYIFKDDTIKSLRNKITMSLPVSEKFGKDMKLLPETLYFWSEYTYNKKVEQIMLGQKWIRRNELLKVDIIPNENLKVYEKLRNNLSYLKDSFGYKIKREDDENNIIRSYEDFITSNEIYMLDIYNDLGSNYTAESEDKRNLYDVYTNIYYPMISYDRLEQIIEMLNGKNNREEIFVENHFGTLRNDMLLESQIETTVEKAKLEMDNTFMENHILQSIIHVNILDPKNITGTTSDTKFNLYRIFDNFIVNQEYPFIQFQTADMPLTYKFYTEFGKNGSASSLNVNTHEALLSKWFENAPYGISVKVKINEEKYISINIYETGRIEYKITWKETEEATVKDINSTYDNVRELLKKINSENKKIKVVLPPDDRFKYAFINTIQKFTIPDKYKINHNDLSDFSRYFFPYVALVIEPKKRRSKKETDVVDEVSKYGTYLRYKRINNYNNRTKMHMRILFYLRNYDISDRDLIDEISKQFNITPEQSAKELDYVKDKFQKIIKGSKKLLNKMKTMPKSKPPGVGIDIQGREKDRYKIRITGARNKEQLVEIVDFMRVLIYLYVETYLKKNPEYLKVKDILKNLNKIAKRRNKCNEVYEYDGDAKTVKTITNLDKSRLGFKPEKGQNQWTRSCQNSGKDKKRRPEITPGEQIENLVKDGYKLNKTNGFYEKEITIKKKKGEAEKTIVRAVKLPGGDNTVNYFTCDTGDGQDHKYVGFLAKGNNPNDLCMPCCFKKDQFSSGNKSKMNYFMKCLGAESNGDDAVNKSLGEKVYILQETNKIQDGRFIYLSKYLDIFLNQIWNHDKDIKNHYLFESNSGYFFKYTVKHDYYHFLSAMAHIFDKTIEELIKIIVDTMEKDKNSQIFTYLNNGDIHESFKTIEGFIEFIKTSKYLEYDIVGELLAIPNVLTKKGIVYYILNKQSYVVKKSLEKEEIKEKYFIDCLNTENINQYNADESNKSRDVVILLREGKYYFPIYRLQKTKSEKKMNLQKYYNKETNKDVIEELDKYHNKSCKSSMISKITTNNNLVAKNILTKVKIKKQFIDERKKCRYIQLENDFVIPVIPSGIHYDYPIANLKKIPKHSLILTIKNLEQINKVISLDYNPKTVFYDKRKDNNINIISILLHNGLTIPIENENIDIKKINKLGLAVGYQPLSEAIDQEIINYNNEIVYDERGKNVKEHNYKSESYNLYRLELSHFLSYSEQREVKEMIIKIVRDTNMDKKDRKYELRKILFKIMDNKVGKKKFVHLMKHLPDLKNYLINNVRDLCEINKTEDKCSSNYHCIWKDNTCRLNLLDNLATDFVNKVIEEMVQDGVKFKEIIQESSYYVSDIVDYTQYTNRPDQKIIKTGNFNIQKLMSELFGKDKIPTIGKRQTTKKIIDENDESHELVEIGNQLIQLIVPNKDSVIRAFINSYYWLNNPLYDNESRNLGYYSELQTDLCYLFKANIIDFIQNYNNADIKKYLTKYFKTPQADDNFFDSTLNKFRKSSYNTDGKMELFILSHLIPIPIVVYDNFNNVKYLYLQGEISISEKTIQTFTNSEKLKSSIILKFDYESASAQSSIPKNIHSIYY